MTWLPSHLVEIALARVSYDSLRNEVSWAVDGPQQTPRKARHLERIQGRQRVCGCLAFANVKMHIDMHFTQKSTLTPAFLAEKCESETVDQNLQY